MVKKELLSLIAVKPHTIFYSLKYLILQYLEEGVNALLSISPANKYSSECYVKKRWKDIERLRGSRLGKRLRIQGRKDMAVNSPDFFWPNTPGLSGCTLKKPQGKTALL